MKTERREMPRQLGGIAGLTIRVLYRSRLLAPLGRLARSVLAARRSVDIRELLGGALPRLISSMQPVEGLPSPETWVVAREAIGVSSLVVAPLGPPGAAPAAVVKLARSPEVVEELRAHVRAVQALSGDPRIGPWGRYLPDFLALGLTSEPAAVVERYMVGIPLTRMLRREPDLAARSISACLEVIGELHTRTASVVTTADHLAAWLDGPLAAVSSLYPAGAWQLSKLGCLGDELRQAVGINASTPASWIHGDYTRDNIFLSPDGGEVLGILDWGSARPVGVAAVDAYLLLLSSAAYRQRRALGHVVVDVARERGPSALDPLWASVEMLPSGRRALVLLTWLQHVAHNLAKAATYRDHLAWRALNIDVVLRKLVV